MNDFKYKYGLDPARSRTPASGSRKLRLVLLFVLVLAVTGGIIYYLIPHESSEPQPAQPGDKKVEAGTGQPGNDGPAGGSSTAQTGNPTGSEAPSGTASATASENGKTDVSDPTADDPRDPAEDPPAGNDPAAGESDNAQGASTRGGAVKPTEFPEKGQPWVGDPPSEQPGAPDAPKNDTPAPDAAHLVPLYSGSLGDDAETVRVRAGDNLSRIAVRKHTTVEALRHFNRLKGDNIVIGRKLRLLPGPWQITVDKTSRELRLERSVNGEWQNYATFKVGLGRMDSTPEAEFVISTRLRHPDWYAPDGRVLRYGEAENPLGEYFLKLARSGAPDKPLRGYGIHGTNDESTVGKNWSRGCVRMRNRDVELLYYLVPSGTPVKIVSGGTVQKSEK